MGDHTCAGLKEVGAKEDLLPRCLGILQVVVWGLFLLLGSRVLELGFGI